MSDYESIIKYNKNQITSKAIQELQGLITAIIYDNIVTNEEIKLLFDFRERYRNYFDSFPLNEISTYLNDFAYNEPNENKITEFLNFLVDLSILPEHDPILKQIFDNVENVIVPNNNFVVTGALKYGTRIVIQEKITKLGGNPQNRITNDTDYLIVGDDGSDSYKFSKFGRKIQKAIDMKEKNHKIKIITESLFMKTFLPSIKIYKIK